MLHPKLAASLNTEKYRVMPFTMWVRPAYSRNDFSGAEKPIFCCFHAQNAANIDNTAHTLKNCFTL